MSLIEKISQYKTTSTSFFELEKIIDPANVSHEERFVRTHSSYQKKTFFDLSKHKDSKLNAVKQDCLNICIDAFPNYSTFVSMRSAYVLGDFCERTWYNTFRISASRNDNKKQIFLTIELAFDKDLHKQRRDERKKAEQERLEEEAEAEALKPLEKDEGELPKPTRRRALPQPEEDIPILKL